MNLMCPVCREQLILQEKTWRCIHQHSYDQAKQGYVNLHVVQHKHSKTPGDTPEAVAARRRFLSAGFYQKLQQKIVDVIQPLDLLSAIDIGCGEGYYTQAIAQQIPHLIAVDIAKSAVQIAAKQDRQRQVTWVVGTGAILPVQDQSLQLCSSFFSPLPKAEMLRVLQPQGYLLVATPAPQHLLAMRHALFDEVKPHEPEKFVQQLAPEFQLLEQFLICDQLQLNQQQLQDLIAMTPYAWKAKAELRTVLEQQAQFSVEAQFCLYLFQKSSGPIR
ncbi:methyltransferase domain-containing protein [Acinetobacter qingfengensis]|uniref:Methyltransferase n=1 Tax=Acinetobacter qingfengensis TaxID=1262585 RepID=A0A1E7QYX3_9GAMM|nr:methyltransferase domain-containing protein [Acinetobacter qingfengensis]KAA8733148.1 methyltransferase domain-containing protein [Acinetobacter qingfengensis]OEY92298.1 methyltransferase [Acinetobacter qingfengensis]